MPEPRKVWQVVVVERPAAFARRLIMVQAFLRFSGSSVSLRLRSTLGEEGSLRLIPEFCSIKIGIEIFLQLVVHFQRVLLAALLV